jgi:hypothetical protein
MALAMPEDPPVLKVDPAPFTSRFEVPLVYKDQDGKWQTYAPNVMKAVEVPKQKATVLVKVNTTCLFAYDLWAASKGSSARWQDLFWMYCGSPQDKGEDTNPTCPCCNRTVNAYNAELEEIAQKVEKSKAIAWSWYHLAYKLAYKSRMHTNHLA